MNGKLYIVGIGPGNDEHITPAALSAIREAEFVIGYTTYIGLVRHHLGGKQVTRTGMTEEISRARNAVETAAAGHTVTLISSGDSGVYGMAGLVFEVLRERGWVRGQSPEIHLVPGITAANSCASLVGAPLIHDSCRISLSDLLTPWPVIEKRLESAASGDFVICLYNPASGRRQRQIVEATRIIRAHRPGTTPVALVKSAYRKQESVVISDLDHFLEFEIGMNTTVIIGSSNTFVYEGYMVTPRGHTNKYRLEDGSVIEGQRPARSLNCDGNLADRFRGTESPEPNLNITKISGAFMRTATERFDELPAISVEAPIVARELEQDSSVRYALDALSVLKRVQTKAVVENNNQVASTPSNLGWIARLAGGIVFRSGTRYFLVGDLKEPCSFEEFGFQQPKREGTADRQWVELHQLEPPREIRLDFNIAIGLVGESGAQEVYRRFAIYRNSSISERLMNLVNEVSPRGRDGSVIDASWLSDTPQAVWDMVRDTVLKCS